MDKTRTQVSVRVSYEFKERLEAQAKRERRPVSNMIINVMSDYLDEKEKEIKKEPPNEPV